MVVSAGGLPRKSIVKVPWSLSEGEGTEAGRLLHPVRDEKSQREMLYLK
jgi:hypothetical protein